MKIFKVIVFALLIASCNNKQEPTNNLMNYSDEILEKAQAIHDRVLVLDTHVDISVTNFTADKNYTEDLGNQVNLPTMEAGGLDVAWFIVYTGQGELNEAGYEKAAKNAQEKFDAIHRLTDIYAPDRMALATSAEEVRNVRRTGRKVAMIGVENAYSLGLDTANVKKFYDQGARYMSLAHNGHSQFADSNTGEIDGVFLHNGLSPLGKLVIEKMNYYGIMLDISHPSKEANRQAILHSKAPVIASHSSARGLSDHPRNLDDEQLEWVKASGGVVQTVALALYVNKEKHLAHQEAKNAVLRLLSFLQFNSTRLITTLDHRHILAVKPLPSLGEGFLHKVILKTFNGNLDCF